MALQETLTGEATAMSMKISCTGGGECFNSQLATLSGVVGFMY
mgnify:CR=1 FL=1